MLHKFNTFARILVVLLLVVPIYPIETAYASEVTETETFDGTDGAQVTDLVAPFNSGTIAIRNDQNCCGVGGQYFLSLKNNYSGSAQATSYTFTLPHTDHDIKELGFRMAGVNENYTIQYNYSDSTSDTVSYNAQNSSTYEDIVRTITDKYFTNFIITVSDWSGIDTIYWKYDSTPVLNAPQNLTGTVNYENGTVLVDWDAPASSNTSVERYAIGFGIADDSSTPYGIATGNVGDSTALNTEYTFTASYLKSVFTDAHGLFNVKIRADNDTSSVYSSYTSTLGVTIVNKPPKPTNLAVAESSGTYRLSWTAPTGGFVDASSYRVYMKVGDNDYVMINAAITETYFDVQHTNLTETTDFLYYIASCGSENDCNVDSTNTVGYTYTYSAPALGPPMNPVVSNVYNDGVLVDWDEANSGNTDAETYELYYRISGTSENTVVTGITDTQYTIPYSAITDNTYVFSIRAINTTESLTSGYSTEPTLGVVNQKVIDDIAAQVAYEQQVAYEAEVAATNAEIEANAAETGVYETNSEREYREATEVIVIVLDDGSEGNYTQNDVNDGTVERDNQRAANEAEYGCYITDEAIERGDCGYIEIYEDEEEVYDDDAYDEDIYADDGYLRNPEDTNEDLPIYDEDEVVWFEDEPIYEVYDEEEGWVEVSEEEFEEILEYEAELDAKELEILNTYDDEYLEDLNLYIPEEEFEGLTDEEILILEEELQKDFEEFIETVLAVEQYLEELEEYEQEVILIEIVEFEDVVIVFEEDELLEDFPEDELPPVIIIEDFPDEDPIEIVTELEEILEEERLTDDELESLSEDEVEEYREERKEVVEAYVEDLEEEILEEVLPETVTVEEFEEIKEKDVEELTEEEIEIVVEVATEVIEEVVNTEELTEVIEAEDLVILEQQELEELSEEEVIAYEEEVEAVIQEFVEELETEELVVVVEQVAEVGVENLAQADEQTVKVIQAVVTEVVDTETVAELSEEEVEAVAEVLGFEEEEDVQIIAEAAAEDEVVAEAVSEYVERKVANADVQGYTLADVVTEVQMEEFLANPVGAIIDIDIQEINITEIGTDMTSDQKEKAQEVVVPVIIVSQIVAGASLIPVRRIG